MKYTFKSFQAEYPNDAACLAKIMEVQHGGTTITCPSCGAVGAKFHAMTKRRAYACQLCGHHIYPCAGTIFEKSRTNLTKWFFAMYLMTSTRHGVAAKEIERQIGCTYKTAWRMCHELRKLMASADNHKPLSGHVEVDETYVGGRKPGRRGGAARHKTVLFGMAERGGPLRTGPVPNVKRRTLQTIIAKNVRRGSIVSTDELSTYGGLTQFGYRHGKVNHSAKEYVSGIHHVNSLEGHWSRLKNSIQGTHIHVSPQHLWKYASEFSFRHNMRKEPGAMFSRLVEALSLPRLAAG